MTNEPRVPQQGMPPGSRPGSRYRARPPGRDYDGADGPASRPDALTRPGAGTGRTGQSPGWERPTEARRWPEGGYPPRPSPRRDDQPTEVISRRAGTAVTDAPTEIIDAIGQGGDPPEDPPGGAGLDELPPEGRGRKAVRVFGELLITAGLVLLLFVFYEVKVTDWLSAGRQHHAADDLDSRWKERNDHFSLVDGQGFAKLHIPVFGPDYVFTLLEGTSDKALEIGPGHYRGTALPGEPGNFAVAGHRVGKGAPFNDLDMLHSCDSIVIETQTDWFVYRVLPMDNEIKNWQQAGANRPLCNGVSPLGGQYADTVGQEIVSPSESDVIAPIPHHQGALPSKGQQAALITLTTCHPRFSAKQRLIVHGVLVKQYPKDPKHPEQVPAELREES